MGDPGATAAISLSALATGATGGVAGVVGATVLAGLSFPRLGQDYNQWTQEDQKTETQVGQQVLFLNQNRKAIEEDLKKPTGGEHHHHHK